MSFEFMFMFLISAAISMKPYPISVYKKHIKTYEPRW